MKNKELLERAAGILKISSASSFQDVEHIGNLDVAKYLENWAKPFFQTKIVPSPKSDKDVTLFIWPKGKDFPNQGNLALHTHLDTVQAGKLEDWTEGGPWEAKHQSGILVGLGAADVKSDAICKIMAMIDFADSKFSKIFPFFVGSFAEEIGMQGARWIYESKFIQPQYALVGEPSDGYLSYANKGLGLLEGRIPFEAQAYSGKKFEIHYEGSSGHSSAPHKAINALELALDDLSYQIKNKTPIGGFAGSIAANVIPGRFSLFSTEKIIPEESLIRLVDSRNKHKEFQTYLSKTKNDEFDPPSPTSAWTLLQVRENEIYFQIEVRFLPDQDIEDLVQSFKDNSISIQLRRSSPSARSNPNTNFAKILAECSRHPAPWITKSGSNESYFYQALGAECFVHGPGVSYGNIHRPNEKIAISSLEQAYEFYRKVIEKICL